MPGRRVAPPRSPTNRSSGLTADPARLKAARRFINAQGCSIKEWAENKGFKVRNVYRVLEGDRVAYRGESHRIAVALGLKPGIISPPLELDHA